MKEFKVGDWVTLLDKWVHKVEAVSKNGRVLFLNTREIPQADNWWGIDQCTPWQPKEGEWVIPNTKTTESFNVFRYTENYKGFKLQPFIGELPSFLKENNNATS